LTNFVLWNIFVTALLTLYVFDVAVMLQQTMVI